MKRSPSLTLFLDQEVHHLFGIGAAIDIVAEQHEAGVSSITDPFANGKKLAQLVEAAVNVANGEGDGSVHRASPLCGGEDDTATKGRVPENICS